MAKAIQKQKHTLSFYYNNDNPQKPALSALRQLRKQTTRNVGSRAKTNVSAA